MPMSWGNDAEKLFMKAAIIPDNPYNEEKLCHAFLVGHSSNLSKHIESYQNAFSLARPLVE